MRNWAPGPVSRKSRGLFGPEKPIVGLQSASFEKLIFEHVLNVRKTKRIAKFDGLEPRRCEDIKVIVAPEIGPKSFGTFEEQAPGARFSKVPKTFRARKAIRETPTCLICKAGLFICCIGNKNQNNCKVSCLETPSF